MTGIPDRGYDDRDDYTSTVEGAIASAAAHAIDDEADWAKPTRQEIADEERAERRRWRR